MAGCAPIKRCGGCHHGRGLSIESWPVQGLRSFTPRARPGSRRKRRAAGSLSSSRTRTRAETEKLLLLSGAIYIAGTVKARKASRYATSDWMEIEKQRGMSVVQQMEYHGCVIHLLDTLGHQAFSEDQYRAYGGGCRETVLARKLPLPAP